MTSARALWWMRRSRVGVAIASESPTRTRATRANLSRCRQRASRDVSTARAMRVERFIPDADALARMRDAYDARGYVVVEDYFTLDFVRACREELRALLRCVCASVRVETR